MTNIKAKYNLEEWKSIISHVKTHRDLPIYYEQKLTDHTNRKDLIFGNFFVFKTSIVASVDMFAEASSLTLTNINNTIKAMQPGSLISWMLLLTYLAKDPSRAGIHEKAFLSENKKYLSKLPLYGKNALVPFGSQVVSYIEVKDKIEYKSLDFAGTLKDGRKAFVWHKHQNNYGGSQDDAKNDNRRCISASNNLDPRKYFVMMVCDGDFYGVNLLSGFNNQCFPHVVVMPSDEAHEYIVENFKLI